MANNAQWECSIWGNGQTVMAYWDSMHAEDIVIVLEPDGTAYIRDYEFENEDGYTGGTEVRMPIDNLALWLRQWAEARRADGA